MPDCFTVSIYSIAGLIETFDVAPGQSAIHAEMLLEDLAKFAFPPEVRTVETSIQQALVLLRSRRGAEAFLKCIQAGETWALRRKPASERRE